jgi:hypothetical protein
MVMPPFKELQLEAGDSQSFVLENHDIVVRYLQVEPNHVLEISVDGNKKTIIVEEQQQCDEPKSTKEKVVDEQGNVVAYQTVVEQEHCWWHWQQGDIDFSTDLNPDISQDSIPTTLKLLVWVRREHSLAMTM